MTLTRLKVLSGVKWAGWTLIVVIAVFVIIANMLKIIEENEINSKTPAVYKSIEIKDKEKVEAGSTLSYKLDYCRYVDQSVKTDVLVSLLPVSNQKLADIPLGVSYVNPEERCSQVEVDRLIPAEALAGTYQLQICGYYYVLVGRPPKPVCIKSGNFDVKHMSQRALELNNIQNQLDELKQISYPDMQPISVTPPESAIAGTLPQSESQALPSVSQTPQTEWTYKVMASNGEQLGAYNKPENAVTKYNYTGGLARIIDRLGNDVTNRLLGGSK